MGCGGSARTSVPPFCGVLVLASAVVAGAENTSAAPTAAADRPESTANGRFFTDDFPL